MISHILALDPGLVSTGVAIGNIDSNTLELKEVDTRTVELEFLENMILPEHGNVRDQRLLGFRNWLVSLIEEYDIITVGYETPFYDRRKPNAHESLVEVCMSIRMAVCEYNPAIPIHGFSPAAVKRGIGLKGNAKKEEVERRVRELYPDLVRNISQHEADAVGVLHTLLQKLGG